MHSWNATTIEKIEKENCLIPVRVIDAITGQTTNLTLRGYRHDLNWRHPTHRNVDRQTKEGTNLKQYDLYRIGFEKPGEQEWLKTEKMNHGT